MLARISLCDTRRNDVKSAPSRDGSSRSTILKRISCASCLSAVPCHDRSAECPETLLTSSASNSRLAALSHVRSLIVNQPCHAFAGGKLRELVGAHHDESETGDVRLLDSQSTFAPTDLPMRRQIDLLFPPRQTVSSALLRKCFMWPSRWKSRALHFLCLRKSCPPLQLCQLSVRSRNCSRRRHPYLQQRWAQ